MTRLLTCPLLLAADVKEKTMTPQEIIERLRKCAVGDCVGCPNRYVDDYQAGCGKLLSDAALLLSASYCGSTIAFSLEKGVKKE